MFKQLAYMVTSGGGGRKLSSHQDMGQEEDRSGQAPGGLGGGRVRASDSKGMR